jgi:hypothetical protein
MILRRHRVLVGVVAGGLLVGAAGLAAAAPGRFGPATVSPAAADPEGFVGVTPLRVLDTRAGDGPIGVPAAAPIGANQEITLPLTTAAPNRASAPVPANAVSVLLNITIDKNATADSFITVWPTGQPRPNSSANNATPGLVMPNSIVVPLGVGGAVSIYNFTGNVDIAVDLAGYTVPLVGSSIQGPPGPKGDTGVQGPPGIQGPPGPSAEAKWDTRTLVASADLTAAPSTIVAVGPFAPPVANFVVTASFRAVTTGTNSQITCELLDGSGTLIPGATMTLPQTTVSEAATLTGVATDTNGASLSCSSQGLAVASIHDVSLVVVVVGEPIT